MTIEDHNHGQPVDNTNVVAHEADESAPPSLTDRISAVFQIARAIVDPPQKQALEKREIPHDEKQLLDNLQLERQKLEDFEIIVQNRRNAVLDALALGMSQSEIDSTKDTLLDPVITARWVSRVAEIHGNIANLEKQIQALREERLRGKD